MSRCSTHRREPDWPACRLAWWRAIVTRWDSRTRESRAHIKLLADSVYRQQSLGTHCEAYICIIKAMVCMYLSIIYLQTSDLCAAFDLAVAICIFIHLLVVLQRAESCRAVKLPSVWGFNQLNRGIIISLCLGDKTRRCLQGNVFFHFSRMTSTAYS